jgi:hypothetical protein
MVAEYQLAALPPGYEYTNVNSGPIAYTPPPDGTWYFVMFLWERNILNGIGYQYDDWRNFPGTVTVGPPPPPAGQLQMPSPVVFSAQQIGTQSAAMTATITNIGSSAVTISNVTGTDLTEFPGSTTCLTTIPAGGNCQVTVSFLPTTAGLHSETITITSNGVGSPQSFSVSGTGSDPSSGLDLNQHGLTGSWYEAVTSGQGFEVEVFPNQSPGSGFAQVSWFTFDTAAGGEDHQRWYTLGGNVVSGQPNAALTIYQNTGGNFNALPVTTAQAVGTATLSFATCSSGQLSYNFTDGTGRTGNIPLTRLIQNVTCSTTPPYATNTDFALSGNWYDPTTAGQGFTIEVNPDSGALFAAWYTYAPMGAAAGAAGQRWYTAQATFTAGLRSMPVTIYETTGGIFNMPTPPGQQTVGVGIGTLAFQSCTAATFSYTFTGGSSSGLSGTINLSRVGPVPPGCAS